MHFGLLMGGRDGWLRATSHWLREQKHFASPRLDTAVEIIECWESLWNTSAVLLSNALTAMVYSPLSLEGPFSFTSDLL